MRTKRRGSVAIFAMILITSTAAVAITLISLTASVRAKQTRLENAEVIQAAFDGAIDYVQDHATRGILRPPQTIKSALGEVTATLDITERGGKTIRLAGTDVTPDVPTLVISAAFQYKDKTYRRQQMIGRGRITTVWQYAIYSHSGLSTIRKVSTGSAGLEGDAWFSGNATFLGLGTRFGGDLTSTGDILPPTVMVDGKKTANSPKIDFPSIDRNAYLNVATDKLVGDSVIKGYVFNVGKDGDYPVVYIDGKATVEGAFTGTGLIYAREDLTITGDIQTGVKDHLLIIGEKNIIVTTGINIDAYLFAKGDLRIETIGKTRTFSSGVVADKLVVGDNISASFDPWIRDNPLEAYNLKVPGEWP